MRARAAACAAVLLTAGCVLPDVDFNDKHCDDGRCPAGYFCDHSRPFDFPGGACVEGAGRPCDTSTHLVCDDFEAAQLDPRWVVFAPGGTELVLDRTRAHQGSQSLRATVATTPIAMIQLDPFTGRLGLTDQWARAFFLLEDASETSAVIMYMSGMTQYPTALATLLRPDSLELDSNYLSMPVDAGAGLPAGRWICIEQHVSYGANGRVELYVDNLLRYADVADTTGLGTLGRVWLGIDSSSTFGTEETVFVDDVVLSTTRIGCGPAD